MDFLNDLADTVGHFNWGPKETPSFQKSGLVGIRGIYHTGMILLHSLPSPSKYLVPEGSAGCFLKKLHALELEPE